MSEGICKWIKDEKGNRLGILVAIKNGDVFNIDYSFCASFDKFDPKLAVEMATNRCKKAIGRKARIHQRLLPEIQFEYMMMIQRATRYFKDCKPSEKVEWVKKHYNYREFEATDGTSRGSIVFDTETR